MSALDIVRAILAADSNIAPGISDIAALVAPPNLPKPALVLHLVNEDDGAHLNGANWYPLASIIVDSVATSFGAASLLGDKVKVGLIDFRGEIAGAEVSSIFPSGIDHFDNGEKGDVWRRRLGFEMRYRAA